MCTSFSSLLHTFHPQHPLQPERRSFRFRWVGGVQLAVTGEPGCTCNPLTSFCTIRWLIDESKDPAYPQNEDLHFKVATANPSKTPFLTDNYWKVAHMKGTVVKSSHIHRGWDVNPQLENVEVKLTGTKYAAGKISAIEVTFTPITDADTLKIEAIFPTQFNFDQSTVPLPYDIDSRSEGATLIINRGGFRAGVMTTIAINTVRLGRAGGQTRFNFITYNDDTMSEKRDEKLGFTGGFRLPGLWAILSWAGSGGQFDRISVVNAPVLRSQRGDLGPSDQPDRRGYQEAKAQFPVESLFQPRVQEERSSHGRRRDAKAQFTLSFSRAVQASERLLVTCQGQAKYQLKQSPFVVIGIGPIETSARSLIGGFLSATLKPGRPATEVALQADTPYTIIMLVLPVQGTNTWRFDTSDGGALPTNTNDGELNGFSPVEQFVLGVEAVRSPPRAVVDVTLSIEVGNAIVRELIIVAPPSFLFDESAGGCGDMCLPGSLHRLGRLGTATIASPTGEPLTQLQGIKVRVLTPYLTPSSVTWFVEGRGQGAGTTVGWGRGPGFFVTQMAATSVMCA
ncbi:Superoxide dismutase [Fe] [Durusdinium trenchii]|uniref:Superoxide dismutase [Fe] n=1 Tax=Durusdinium trenchii TaxID=1381693 RepID=A0ABP0RXB6_9DINO